MISFVHITWQKMGNQLLKDCLPPLSEIWHPANKHISSDVTFHI